jgi:hypothetical protein
LATTTIRTSRAPVSGKAVSSQSRTAKPGIFLAPVAASVLDSDADNSITKSMPNLSSSDGQKHISTRPIRASSNPVRTLFHHMAVDLINECTEDEYEANAPEAGVGVTEQAEDNFEELYTDRELQYSEGEVEEVEVLDMAPTKPARQKPKPKAKKKAALTRAPAEDTDCEPEDGKAMPFLRCCFTHSFGLPESFTFTIEVNDRKNQTRSVEILHSMVT